MGFGPTVTATLGTVDVSAPGAPGLSMQQISNGAGALKVIPPTIDADGSPLTGLTFAQAVVIQADAETAAGFVDNFDGAIAFPGAQVFMQPFDGSGESVETEFAIATPGLPYSAVVRCADHPAP